MDTQSGHGEERLTITQPCNWIYIRWGPQNGNGKDQSCIDSIFIIDQVVEKQREVTYKLKKL